MAKIGKMEGVLQGDIKAFVGLYARKRVAVIDFSISAGAATLRFPINCYRDWKAEAEEISWADRWKKIEENEEEEVVNLSRTYRVYLRFTTSIVDWSPFFNYAINFLMKAVNEKKEFWENQHLREN